MANKNKGSLGSLDIKHRYSDKQVEQAIAEAGEEDERRALGFKAQYPHVTPNKYTPSPTRRIRPMK